MEDFKVLKSYAIANYGTSHEYIEIVVCPRCQEEFPRLIKSGCFNEEVTPDICPKCDYPLTLKGGIKVYNPSKR